MAGGKSLSYAENQPFYFIDFIEILIDSDRNYQDLSETINRFTPLFHGLSALRTNEFSFPTPVVVGLQSVPEERGPPAALAREFPPHDVPAVLAVQDVPFGRVSIPVKVRRADGETLAARAADRA